MAAQFLKLWGFFLVIDILTHSAPSLAQSPIDLPQLSDEPASNLPSLPYPQYLDQAATSHGAMTLQALTGLDIAAQLGLKLNSRGFGMQGIFLQRLIGVLSASQSLELQRWQAKESQWSESEFRALLGFHLGPVQHYLFEPFVHVKGGIESWQLGEISGSNPVAAHDIGLMIKLTRNFWLTLARSDLYYGKNLEERIFRRKINDRHYSSSEAYFTLAF